MHDPRPGRLRCVLDSLSRAYSLPCNRHSVHCPAQPPLSGANPRPSTQRRSYNKKSHKNYLKRCRSTTSSKYQPQTGKYVLSNFAMTGHAAQGKNRKRNPVNLARCRNHLAILNIQHYQERLQPKAHSFWVPLICQKLRAVSTGIYGKNFVTLNFWMQSQKSVSKVPCLTMQNTHCEGQRSISINFQNRKIFFPKVGTMLESSMEFKWDTYPATWKQLQMDRTVRRWRR